jgi:hypothetical protein
LVEYIKPNYIWSPFYKRERCKYQNEFRVYIQDSIPIQRIFNISSIQDIAFEIFPHDKNCKIGMNGGRELIITMGD